MSASASQFVLPVSVPAPPATQIVAQNNRRTSLTVSWVEAQKQTVFLTLSPNPNPTVIGVAQSAILAGPSFDLNASLSGGKITFTKALEGDVVCMPWYALLGSYNTFVGPVTLSVVECFDDSLPSGHETSNTTTENWYYLWGLDPNGNPLTGPNAPRRLPPKRPASELQIYIAGLELVFGKVGRCGQLSQQ